MEPVSLGDFMRRLLQMGSYSPAFHSHEKPVAMVKPIIVSPKRPKKQLYQFTDHFHFICYQFMVCPSVLRIPLRLPHVLPSVSPGHPSVPVPRPSEALGCPLICATSSWGAPGMQDSPQIFA